LKVPQGHFSAGGIEPFGLSEIGSLFSDYSSKGDIAIEDIP
jgi:hypothetical protein